MATIVNITILRVPRFFDPVSRSPMDRSEITPPPSLSLAPEKRIPAVFIPNPFTSPQLLVVACDIKGLLVCSHFSRPRNRSKMRSFLSVAPALILSFLVNVVAGHGSCKEPRVRREWRSLEPSERQDWIDAVNVCTHLTTPPSVQAIDWRFLVPRHPPSRSQHDAFRPSQRITDSARQQNQLSL